MRDEDRQEVDSSAVLRNELLGLGWRLNRVSRYFEGKNWEIDREVYNFSTTGFNRHLGDGNTEQLETPT